jgi:hypothetical protein
LGKDVLGKAQRLQAVMRMRQSIGALVKQLGTHLLVSAWSQYTAIFLQVASVENKNIGKKKGLASLRVSMGSMIEDQIVDPALARDQPEVGGFLFVSSFLLFLCFVVLACACKRSVGSGERHGVQKLA